MASTTILSTTVLRVLLLCFLLITRGSTVLISGGTSTLGGMKDQCSDIQEFSCINDICDQQAGLGASSGGKCRNGDAASTACTAGQFCGKPTAGHCLENTISEAGSHAMPDKSRGTPKHFYCVSVTNFDKPVLLWQNNDCTGQSCFIPNAGQFATWSRGAQGNCVEIDPVVPVNTTACIAAGQNSQFPPNGGFPTSVPEVVGGNYGLPAAWENSNECSAILGSSTPASIPTNDTLPPEIDASQRYQSNIADNQGFGLDNLYRRDGVLVKRASPITQALRDAYNYRNIYIAARSTWLVITSTGHLRAWTGSVVGNHLSVDHVVELDMIVSFFTGGIGQGAGVSLNQWALLTNFITSRGVQAITGQHCPLYYQFAAFVGGLGNMCGVDQRLNQLKALVLSHVGPSVSYPGTPAPNWSITWTRAEAQGTLEYLMFTSQQAIDAAHDIAGFLDGLPGMGTNGAVAQAFVSYAENLWDQAVALLEAATQQPRGYFIGD